MQQQKEKSLTPFQQRRLVESQNRMMELKKIEIIASVLLQKPKHKQNSPNQLMNSPNQPVDKIEVSMGHNKAETGGKLNFSVHQNASHSPLKRKFSSEKFETETSMPDKKMMKFETPSSSELLFLRVKSDSSEIEKREKQLGELNKTISLGTIQLSLFQTELEYREVKITKTNVNEEEKQQLRTQISKLQKLMKLKSDEIENSKSKRDKLLEEVELCKNNFFDSLKKYNEERINELDE
eukprot:gene11763-5101_t